jgi:hypothetical protein
LESDRMQDADYAFQYMIYLTFSVANQRRWRVALCALL